MKNKDGIKRNKISYGGIYLRITTRCNMYCAHCANSCGPVGEDMDFETFKKALEIYYPCNALYSKSSFVVLSIGGGEPTIHPRFWDFMDYAMSHPSYRPGFLWITTNGKLTHEAMALAKMAQQGLITADLSLDQWHEPIDPAVIKAFTKEPGSNGQDHRGIKSVIPVNAGRCDFGCEGCSCNSVVVKPNGELRFCGCEDAPVIGDVTTGFQKKYEAIVIKHNFGSCWRSYIGDRSSEEVIDLLTKQEASWKNIEESVIPKIIPEFVALYRSGKLSADFLTTTARKFSKDEQLNLMKAFQQAAKK